MLTTDLGPQHVLLKALQKVTDFALLISLLINLVFLGYSRIHRNDAKRKTIVKYVCAIAFLLCTIEENANDLVNPCPAE